MEDKHIEYLAYENNKLAVKVYTYLFMMASLLLMKQMPRVNRYRIAA